MTFPDHLREDGLDNAAQAWCLCGHENSTRAHDFSLFLVALAGLWLVVRLFRRHVTNDDQLRLDFEFVFIRRRGQRR